MIPGFLILIYFGGTMTTCNEDISSCDKRLNELKKEVQDWQERCLNQINGHEITTPRCKAEKDYFQERMSMQTEMCFYSGNHLLI